MAYYLYPWKLILKYEEHLFKCKFCLLLLEHILEVRITSFLRIVNTSHTQFKFLYIQHRWIYINKVISMLKIQ